MILKVVKYGDQRVLLHYVYVRKVLETVEKT